MLPPAFQFQKTALRLLLFLRHRCLLPPSSNTVFSAPTSVSPDSKGYSLSYPPPSQTTDVPSPHPMIHGSLRNSAAFLSLLLFSTKRPSVPSEIPPDFPDGSLVRDKSSYLNSSSLFVFQISPFFSFYHNACFQKRFCFAGKSIFICTHSGQSLCFFSPYHTPFSRP